MREETKETKQKDNHTKKTAVFGRTPLTATIVKNLAN